VSKLASDPIILLAQLSKIETELDEQKYDIAAAFVGRAIKAILEQSGIKKDSDARKNDGEHSIN
jgi:hypothetical protein